MSSFEPNLYATDPSNWRQRLDHVVETMKETSKQTDVESMVQTYTTRVSQTLASDRFLSLSRRGVSEPSVIIARDEREDQDSSDPPPDPWRDRDKLPVVTGGLLSRMIYSDQPYYIEDLRIEADDPGRSFLDGYRSLVAIPVYDDGHSLNMVVLLRRQPAAFDPAILPQMVWTSNLFGRATHAIRLRDQLKHAYEMLDAEMKTIADIQRALLPQQLPTSPTMDLASYYQPATRAGGDYYDLYPLTGNRFGVMIADVSGHGSPAAVHMAITHALAHTRKDDIVEPSDLLNYVNRHFAQRYNSESDKFVTAFFGVYDPATRIMTYSSAGHPPPRVKRCTDGSLFALDEARGLPMGIMADEQYQQATVQLSAGDQAIFYTDGITEAMNNRHELFGVDRLDHVLENCSLTAQGLIDTLLQSLGEFAAGREADDDRTILVAKIK